MYEVLNQEGKSIWYAEKRGRMIRSYTDMPVKQYENRLNFKRGVYSTLFYFEIE